MLPSSPQHLIQSQRQAYEKEVNIGKACNRHIFSIAVCCNAASQVLKDKTRHCSSKLIEQIKERISAVFHSSSQVTRDSIAE